jgi:hypothetical protein
MSTEIPPPHHYVETNLSKKRTVNAKLHECGTDQKETGEYGLPCIYVGKLGLFLFA